jgi:hypothetical protein
MQKRIGFPFLLAAAFSLSTSLPSPTLAENPPAKTYQPGYWQPATRVNPTRPVIIQILNETSLVLEYGLTEQRGFTRIQPGGSSRVNTKAPPMYLVIYPAQAERVSLKFGVAVTGDNAIRITVQIAPKGSDGDLSINVDKTGAIYVS